MARAASGAPETSLTPVPAFAQPGTPIVADRSPLRRLVRRLVLVMAFAYPLALVLCALGFYFVGETWWVTAAGLYAPRLLFAVPLPLLVLLLASTGLRRFMWTQLLAALLVLIPLMGFVLPIPTSERTGSAKLRILSFNVDSGRGGHRAIADKVFELSPDVAVFQETPWGTDLVDDLRTRYPHVQSSTQFIIASRYPIVESTDPARLAFWGRARSPRFMRYVLDTPLGRIALYNIHPISPRGVLHLHQLRAAFHELRTGELFAGDPEGDVRSNASLRSLQISTAAASAASEALPVLIAGDTNLPGLSAVFRENLGRYSDAFRAASSGFGYTFPQNHPFLRLDRVLASEALRFFSFQVGCQGISDHLCVVAEVQAAP